MASCILKDGKASTAVGPMTSNAFTPAAGDLLVVFILASATNDGSSTVTNSAGLTFTQITFAGGTTIGDQSALFVANALATAVSQTCTITFPTDNSTGQIMFVYAVTSMSRTGTSAVRQSNVKNSAASGTTPSIILPVAPLTTNPILGLIANATSPATLTPPTGWTEPALGDLGYSTPTTGAETAFRDNGHTSPTVTWGSTSASNYSMIVAELDITPLPDSLAVPSRTHRNYLLRR